ncbi:hypothetical protein [Rhodococcus xishaensis]|uniref:Uncharacterized protein n=1 Tax=Rhodococcus xishaensis TaxID=2487364 RepID=A0A438B3L6_9NOCA|nr:hypothetical protein [Rhodococcus xishaensis]RVW05556.1 hypothetical protein EGT50_03030 [Rhodococcus xishaensis]
MNEFVIPDRAELGGRELTIYNHDHDQNDEPRILVSTGTTRQAFEILGKLGYDTVVGESTDEFGFESVSNRWDAAPDAPEFHFHAVLRPRMASREVPLYAVVAAVAALEVGQAAERAASQALTAAQEAVRSAVEARDEAVRAAEHAASQALTAAQEAVRSAVEARDEAIRAAVVYGASFRQVAALANMSVQEIWPVVNR